MTTRIGNVGKGSSAQPSLLLLIVCAFASPGYAQFNSGSDGSDGAFNPITNVVINMADHPSGMYQYTSIYIPSNVTVSFSPNQNNTPVVWLVQSNCTIDGIVDVSGMANASADPATGGPGGGRGGNGGSSPTWGQGIGGGAPGGIGNSASFGSSGYQVTNTAPIYGSAFLLPLLGGSGGGGGSGWGGGGGGGALLIAASEVIIRGAVNSLGGAGNAPGWNSAGGAGSGGGIRIICNTFKGTGTLSTQGGSFFCSTGWGSYLSGSGGRGRIRIDCLDYQFGGSFFGCELSKGYQPIIFPSPITGAQLAVLSVAGVAVSPTPSGQVALPDAVISGQQANPVAILVQCSNIPLNTPITVTVQPLGGAKVTATSYNNSGTQASSTATVQMTIPRGGGLIFATAATAN